MPVGAGNSGEHAGVLIGWRRGQIELRLRTGSETAMNRRELLKARMTALPVISRLAVGAIAEEKIAGAHVGSGAVIAATGAAEQDLGWQRRVRRIGQIGADGAVWDPEGAEGIARGIVAGGGNDSIRAQRGRD